MGGFQTFVKWIGGFAIRFIVNYDNMIKYERILSGYIDKAQIYAVFVIKFPSKVVNNIALHASLECHTPQSLEIEGAGARLVSSARYHFSLHYVTHACAIVSQHAQ